MTEITVKRGAGDKLGPDILEPLAATIAALQARGCTELDIGEESELIDIDVGFWPNVEIGQLVRAVDVGSGSPYIGRVISIQHDDLGGGAVTQIVLDVPASAVDPDTLLAAEIVDNGDGSAQVPL